MDLGRKNYFIGAIDNDNDVLCHLNATTTIRIQRSRWSGSRYKHLDKNFRKY